MLYGNTLKRPQLYVSVFLFQTCLQSETLTHFLATSPPFLATSPHILATSPPPDVLGFSPVVFLIFSGCICNFSVCILSFSGCSTCCWFLCEHSSDRNSKKDLLFVRSEYLKRIEPLIHRITSTNKASDCTFL